MLWKGKNEGMVEALLKMPEIPNVLMRRTETPPKATVS
jgi:hypothetical protein